MTGALLLQGCPQLLDDDFLSRPAPVTSDPPPCIGAGCGVQGADAAAPRDAGATPLPKPPGPKPPGPKPPPPPTEGDASAPVDSGSEASDTPSCWTVVLNDSTHIASNNCLDIHGWNSAVVDEEDGDTSVTRTYADGKVCFSGQLDDEGWGMVYNLTFADDATWNAATRGVSGITFEVSGPNPLPEVEVIYTVNGNQDFCHALDPFVSTTVPFASAHPDCSTNPTSASPNVTALTHLRLHFPVGASTRPFDFCVGIAGAP